MPWSPAKGNSSFELQRNSQEEQHSRWGEQKILYCSFETVPTQFPQSRASNSFSILTVPHYCLSRETPNLSPSGDLISRDSKDTIAKSTQIVLGKQKLIFLKKSLCSDRFHNSPSLHMSLSRLPPSSFFSSTHG